MGGAEHRFQQCRASRRGNSSGSRGTFASKARFHRQPLQQAPSVVFSPSLVSWFYRATVLVSILICVVTGRVLVAPSRHFDSAIDRY